MAKGPVEVAPILIRDEMLADEEGNLGSNPDRADSSWSAIMNNKNSSATSENQSATARSSIKSTIGTSKSSVTFTKRRMNQLSPVIEEPKTVRNASIVPIVGYDNFDFVALTTRRDYLADVISVAETGRTTTKWTRDSLPCPPRPDCVPPLSFNQLPWVDRATGGGLKIRNKLFQASSSESSPVPTDIFSPKTIIRPRKFSGHHLLDNANRLSMINNMLVGKESSSNDEEEQSEKEDFGEEVVMKAPVRLRSYSAGTVSLRSDLNDPESVAQNLAQPFPKSVLDKLERLKSEQQADEPSQADDVIDDGDDAAKPTGSIGQKNDYVKFQRPLLRMPRTKLDVDSLFKPKGNSSIVNEVEQETGARLEPPTPLATPGVRSENLLSVEARPSRLGSKRSDRGNLRRGQKPLGTIKETGDFDVLFQRKGYESPPIPYVYKPPEYDVTLQRTVTTERREKGLTESDDNAPSGEKGEDSYSMIVDAAVWEYKTNPVKISVRKDDMSRDTFEKMLSDPNVNLDGPLRRPNLEFDGPYRLIKPVDLPSGERIYVNDKMAPLYPAKNGWSSDPSTERYRTSAAKTLATPIDEWSKIIDPKEPMNGRINSTIGLKDVYRYHDFDLIKGEVLVDRILEMGAPVRKGVFRENIQPHMGDLDDRISGSVDWEDDEDESVRVSTPASRTSGGEPSSKGKAKRAKSDTLRPPSRGKMKNYKKRKGSGGSLLGTKAHDAGFGTDMLIAKNGARGSVASFYDVNDRDQLHPVPREFGLIAPEDDTAESNSGSGNVYVPREPGELGLPAGYGDLVPRKLTAAEIEARRGSRSTQIEGTVSDETRVVPIRNQDKKASSLTDPSGEQQQRHYIGSDIFGLYPKSATKRFSVADGLRQSLSNASDISWESRQVDGATSERVPSIVTMAEERQKRRIYSRRYVIINSGNVDWSGYRIMPKQRAY